MRALRGYVHGISLVSVTFASNVRFMSIFTQILDDTAATAWGSRNAGIAAVQNQPMVCILPELLRYELEQVLQQHCGYSARVFSLSLDLSDERSNFFVVK